MKRPSLTRHHRSKANQSNNESKTEKRTPVIEWLTVSIGTLMLVATATMTIFTYQLAKRAEEQIAIYDSATKIENRAYIVLDHFNNIEGLEPNKSIKFSVTVINTGQTPAYDIISKTIVSIDTFPNFGADTSDFIRTGVSLGPNLKFPLMSSDGLIATPLRLRGLEMGYVSLYFQLLIKYRDVFRVTHSTSICVRYDFNGKSFVPIKECNYAD